MVRVASPTQAMDGERVAHVPLLRTRLAETELESTTLSFFARIVVYKTLPTNVETELTMDRVGRADHR